MNPPLNQTSILELGNLEFSGNTGKIKIVAENVTIDNKSKIKNLTKVGTSGGMEIISNFFKLDLGSEIYFFSDSGNVENITISANSKVDLLNEVEISNVSNNGKSGDIIITAKEIEFNNSKLANTSNSKGESGNLEISADFLTMNGSRIDTTTFNGIKSGDITIDAHNLFLANSTISSNAYDAFPEDVLSRPGSITIKNTDYIALYQTEFTSEIHQIGRNFTNDNIIAEQIIGGLIKINTDHLAMNESNLSSKLFGYGNAGLINIITQSITLNKSSLNISASPPDHTDHPFGDSNGGIVDIFANKYFILKDSEVSTSVDSTNGNGGSISINSQNLILNSGFITANTKDSVDKGGDITINVRVLIPSQDSLSSKALEPNSPNAIHSFNSRNVNSPKKIPLPQLNLSRILANLNLVQFDSRALNRNMCAVDESSSLHQSGKGGLPIRAGDSLINTLH